MSKNKRSLQLDDSEDEDDPKVTTHLAEVQSRKKSKEFIPEAGQIIEIAVENFMCHKKFVVTFNKHINFITGANGSGKSAIVAAIQLCLGATAKRTGRGDSLSSLIREGHEGHASLRVTLLNQGIDAFKPESYGSQITIERKIVRSGSSGYSLYDHRMKKVSSEKKELEEMLRNFNIFVDNPCCVCTQEESKRFVLGTEKEKYEFFLKASGLFRNKGELDEIQEKISSSREDSDKHVKILVYHKEQIMKIKQDIVRMTQLQDIEREILLLQAKKHWYFVYESQQSLKAVMTDLETLHERLEQARSGLEEARKELQSLGELGGSRSELELLEKEDEEIQKELESVQASYSALNKKKSALRVNIQEAKREKTETNSRLADVRSQIQTLKEKARKDASGDERKLLQSVDEVEREIENLQSEEEKLKQIIMVESQIVEKKKSEEAAAQGSAQRLGSDLANLRRDLSELSSSTGGESALKLKFGSQLPGILSKIESMTSSGSRRVPGGFSGDVLFVGLSISLKDGFEEYSLAIEKSIGKMMNTFIVESSEDRRKLDSILREFRALQTFQILQLPRGPKYNVNRVSTGIPDHPALTALDALNIENPLVFNALVDRSGLESVVLARNEDECLALYVTKNQHGRDEFKRFISRCILVEGHLIRYSNGNQSFESHRHPPKGQLTKDVSKIIRDLESRARDLEVQQEEARRAATEIRSSAQSALEKLHRARSESQNFTQRLRDLQRRKSHFHTKLEALRADQEVDTSYLEDEEQDLKSKLDFIKQRSDVFELQLSETTQETEGATNSKIEIEKKKRQLDSKRQRIKDEIDRYINDRTGYLKRVSQFETALSRIESDIATKSNEKDNLQGRVEQCQAQAETETRNLVENWDGRPLPISSKDSPSSLEKLVDAKRRSLELQRKESGVQGKSLEALRGEYSAAKEDFREKTQAHESLCRRIEEMDTDLEWRKKVWRQQRKIMSEKISQYFDYYLRQKGSSGRVDFNHGENSLQLVCQVDEGDEKTRVRDVRQLSGGEKSYTSFCLLLALGHVIECPFRLMDEYDVYMDEATRGLTINSLMEYGLSSDFRSRQFIILTPLHIKLPSSLPTPYPEFPETLGPTPGIPPSLVSLFAIHPPKRIRADRDERR